VAISDFSFLGTSKNISAVRIFEISNRIVTLVFDSKRIQLFEICEQLPSLISYMYIKQLKKASFFNRIMVIFHISNHA